MRLDFGFSQGGSRQFEDHTAAYLSHTFERFDLVIADESAYSRELQVSFENIPT